MIFLIRALLQFCLTKLIKLFISKKEGEWSAPIKQRLVFLNYQSGLNAINVCYIHYFGFRVFCNKLKVILSIVRLYSASVTLSSLKANNKFLLSHLLSSVVTRVLSLTTNFAFKLVDLFWALNEPNAMFASKVWLEFQSKQAAVKEIEGPSETHHKDDQMMTRK